MTLNSRTLNFSLLLFSFFWSVSLIIEVSLKKGCLGAGERGDVSKMELRDGSQEEMLYRRQTRCRKPLTIRRQLFSLVEKTRDYIHLLPFSSLDPPSSPSH